jgi:ribose transport system permease protein
MRRLLNAVPVLMLLVLIAVFGALAPGFFDGRNLVNIVVQSASIGIVGAGMTFVLLTAGIDLSVGSAMFLSAAIAGKMTLAGLPLWSAFLAVIAVGLLFGGLNALFTARFGILPFVATLATLYIGRGTALYITQTRAMNLPESLLRIGTGNWLGIPAPVWALAAVIGAAHLLLERTAFGRYVFAVGHDVETARKAGIPTRRVLAAVYVVCGLCAALGGLVAVAQLGAVSPTFGFQREFAAIAAAVLGGTSLFGGRGHVFPGTLLGALLIQTVESGLVILNADPYLYPLVTATVIFLAVLLDSVRKRQIEKLSRRRIRPIGVV